MKQEKNSLKIALIQSSLFWEKPELNRDMFGMKIDEIDDEIDLIVLPEMFTTGFTMHPENIKNKEGSLTLDWMKKIATKKKIAIVGSIVFKDNGANYNRLFFVRPDGEYVTYDKRHTFTLAGENEKYKAGKERLIVNYKGFAICPLVCYDLRFPVWSRNTDNFDVLLYVANWPTPRINAWDALLKARAIENMVYCIGVNRIGVDDVGHNYPGHSSLYNPLGQLVNLSEKEETIIVDIFKNEVDEVRNKLRFLNDQDRFNLLN
ncbi:amidohydrolase [Maribacter sp. Asnod1-A12]|uniref:amidohydrolase n=1 Tax=Maribacter sp. Asnod1-A12 TaxID=3160576 RepID=UPI003866869F